MWEFVFRGGEFSNDLMGVIGGLEIDPKESNESGWGAGYYFFGQGEGVLNIQGFVFNGSKFCDNLMGTSGELEIGKGVGRGI